MTSRADDDLIDLLFEQAPFPMLVHDLSVILDINLQSVRQLRGSSIDQFVGKSIHDVVHPLARDAGDTRRQMLAGGQRFWQVNTKLVRTDGTEFSVTGCAVPFRLGEDTLAVAAALPLDCPEKAYGELPRMRAYAAECSLREAALDALPAGIVAMRGFELIYVNSATVRLMRAQSKSDLVGVSVLDLVDDFMREPLRERFSVGVMFATPDNDVPGMVRGLDGSPIRTMCRGCMIESGEDPLRMWVVTSAEVMGDETSQGVPA